jgi:uncharacterized membrane protein YesL
VELKGIMGGLYRVSEWIMRFSVINLLWIIISIPFFYFVMNAFMLQVEIKHLMELTMLFAPAALVAPFTLFPATAAMFASARKWVSDEEDAPLLRTFFGALKSNYLQSMLGGLFYLLVTLVLFVNYQFYAEMQGALKIVSFVFVVFFFIMLVSMFNFFSIMVHFQMKFWQIMKNTFLFSMGRPITSILILATNLTILYISITKITFLIPFFMGSLIAYFSFWHFYRIFKKIKAEQEERQQAELADGQAVQDEK